MLIRMFTIPFQFAHVHFQGMDTGPDGEHYGASIPADLAISLEKVSGRFVHYFRP